MGPDICQINEAHMEYSISAITNEDQKSIIDIFNHYVEHSFAAFPESPLPYEAFDIFLQMSKGLASGALKDPSGKLLGFGMLRPFHPMPAFSRTAEVTYFMDPDYTGKGLGKDLLRFLETTARPKGILTLLAHISSLNTASIHFHRNNGFIECGRFKRVGRKKGRVFDSVWMQKML